MWVVSSMEMLIHCAMIPKWSILHAYMMPCTATECPIIRYTLTLPRQISKLPAQVLSIPCLIHAYIRTAAVQLILMIVSSFWAISPMKMVSVSTVSEDVSNFIITLAIEAEIISDKALLPLRLYSIYFVESFK
jgi:hypothetical protein